MTVLLGGISLMLACVLGIGMSMIGSAAALDARAQLAADAAALAAVAEIGPGGSGEPEATARRYAQLNSARLVECICAPEAGAVQLTVAIGDVAARARAEFDFSLLRPAPWASPGPVSPGAAPRMPRLWPTKDRHASSKR